MTDIKNKTLSSNKISQSPTFSIEEMLEQAQNNTSQENSPSKTMTLQTMDKWVPTISKQ